MTRLTAAGVQTRVFAGSPAEVRNVRTFVGRVIQGCPLADDVVLLASELAANAIVHTASGAGGSFFVSVCAEDRRVRIEVHDLGSAGTPAVRQSTVPGESGAGLSLVETIATRWGHHGGADGRVVWFEVDWQ